MKNLKLILPFLLVFALIGCGTSEPQLPETAHNEEDSIPTEPELTENETDLESQGKAFETKDIYIPKSFLVTAINAYLSGTKVTLDNWGPWNGSNWHVAGSHVLMPNGHKEPIDIPLSPTVKSLFRRYNGYINNMSSSNISVFLDGNKIEVRILFESAGDELKVGCINRRKDAPCKAHLLKHTGQVNNAQVSFWLTPVFNGSTISFEDFDVEFDFDLSPDSWILDKLMKVVNWFIDTDSLI